MDWRRRQLLTAVGGTGVVTLAGCGGLLTGESNYVSQQAKLAPDEGDSGDEFGNAVALAHDRSTALIAAEEDEDPNGEGAGSAYVFTRSDDGWSQRAKLVPDDGDSGDGFGESVDLSGDGSTALVGAETDDGPNGKETGSAYVFARDGNVWSQQAKLVAQDGDEDDWFGTSVALAEDGSTAFIGAKRDEDPNGEGAGSAYVFTRDGTSWSQGAKLAPDDGDSGDGFGYSVALAEDGSAALIGAYEDDEPNGEEAGSAYVFARDGTSWSQQAKLVAQDGDDGDWFGISVALAEDGSTALIGALADRDISGSAYVFSRSGDNWSQNVKVAPDDGDYEDTFGWSVALDGEGSTALIGTPRDDEPNGEEAGSAYVFEEPWEQ